MLNGNKDRNNFWKTKKVCVTGGAALIGSHLVARLIELGVGVVWVADDLSSGKREYLPFGLENHCGDLRDINVAKEAVKYADIVFHLACAHGGRGYVDNHRLECFDNLSLDATVFRACRDVGVEKVIFASSACAYPIDLQQDLSQRDMKLSESMIDYRNIRQADNAYGHAKLSGELVLDAYAEAGYYEAVACRQFTVYGPRVKMNHAIGALIAKTFVKQEPFEIWGDGQQQRNWTFVKDTVEGLILAAEHLRRGAVNIGVEDRITVRQAAEKIWSLFGWRPDNVEYQLDKPVGTLNRVADSSKARLVLGWEPKYSFDVGLAETVDWFVKNHNPVDVLRSLEKSLTAR